VLDVGGSPTDAAVGEGSVWVTDLTGRVIRIDPFARRVVARIPVGEPAGIAVGAGAAWVQTPNARDPLATRLVKIDAKRNRVVGSVALGGGSGLAVGADAVWAARRFTMPEGVERIDAASLALTQRIGLANVDQVAEAGRVLWVIEHDGTVVQVEAASGRVVRRWPSLAPSDATGESAKPVADRDGVWVLSTVNAEILRLAAGRVVLRIPVDRSVRALLASGRDGLWIASGDRLGRDNRLIRIDPDTGKVTATVDIAKHRPLALVTARDTLCVVTADAKVLLVESR
jgi:DNA-binding beta-propeller fold protein YncE